MTDWSKGSPDPPSPYPADRQFLVEMPVASPDEPPRVKKRRKSPGLPSSCESCLHAEHGCCSKHHDDYEEYDPVAVLGLVPRSLSQEDRVRWQEIR